jgi:murein DD-endopeptidase MepM/ murein hydrolase activator NlpD
MENKHFILIFMFLKIFMLTSVYGFENNIINIQISPKNIYQGDVAFLKTYPSKNNPLIRCTWANQSIKFYHDKVNEISFAFLGIDLEEPPGRKFLEITVIDTNNIESIHKIDFKVLKKDYPIQRISLPESQVTLSKTDLERHKREKAILEKAFTDASPQKFWQKSFIIPVEGKVSTPFGVRRILNNKPKSPHSGIDFKASLGTPVAASSNGIVAFTGDHFFSGKSLYIDHGMGIFSMYFHLSSISVTKGDKVTKGQTVGRVGSTGRATGPHLHWGIRVNNQRVDPLSFLRLFE